MVYRRERGGGEEGVKKREREGGCTIRGVLSLLKNFVDVDG